MVTPPVVPAALGTPDDPPAPGPTGRAAGPVLAWIALILVLVARSYRAFILTLVAAAMIPMAWSWSSYVVQSGSMEPGLSVGDVVVAQLFTSSSPVPLGRVMIFTDPASPDGRETLVHRVVADLGNGQYVTAGDANRDRDSTPVSTESFVARPTICVPWVGLPLAWWGHQQIVPLAVWLLLTAAAFYFSSRPPCDPRHRRRKQGRAAPHENATGHAVARRAATSGVAVVGIVALFTAMSPVADAGAAFSARTRNAANTWTFAAGTSAATSQLQVYDTASASGWYQRGSVAVNVYATATSGSKVRSITYRVNNDAAVTVATSSLTFTLSKQGDNTITYFATDGVGAAEAAHVVHVKLDNRSPTLTVTSQTGDMTHAQWRAACPFPGSTGGVCGTTDDGVGSQVATVEYILSRSSDQRCFDGEKWTGAACNKRATATLSTGVWYAGVPDSGLPASRTWYTITVYVVDVAGNGANTTRSFSIG